jgi:hypothetical protein
MWALWKTTRGITIALAPSMGTTGDDVQRYVSRAVAEWARIGDGPPWSRLSESERIDFLPPLFEATLRGTICEPVDTSARADAVRAAAIHGADRRRQGFTEQDLLDEHYLMRLALWSAARDGGSFSLRARAMARADVLLSALMLATLRGYHRDELEAEGRWAAALDDLLAES